jgi:hypothetical protein
MDYHKEQRKVDTYSSTNTLMQPKKYSGIRVMPPYAVGKQTGLGFTINTNSGLQQNSAIQKKSLQKDGPEQIPTGGKPVNALGVVAPEANLRSAPGTDNKPLKLLPFNTRIQIVKDTINFWGQKLDDFNYANQFVTKLLPEKLSDDILEAIKSALLNFAIGMVATGLILAIAAGLGALVGALVGFLAGGAGAVPGAALGAKIGFEIGLFLLKWIGLGMLVAYGAKLLGGIGIAFGKYVISVWEANGDRKKLEKCADLCAEAIKEFLLGVLELVVMLVAALGVGRAMGALANSKFGKAIGTERLTRWVGQRSRYEATKETIKGLSSGKSKWVDAAGNIIWPPNRGFAGIPKKITLKPGTRVDRYGYEKGSFVSPEGTPYPNRALAPGTDKKPYNIYEIVKPVEVEAGEIAPWFAQPGKGIQYEFKQTITELIEAKIIKRVGP